MRRKTLLLFVFSLLCAAGCRADVQPASIFTDNMLLQRDMAVPVWGTATPGEKISVEFAGQRRACTADAQGKWMVHLTPLKASAKPAQMRIRGKNTIVLQNVLVGELWLASGQSNMVCPLPEAANPEQEIAAATDGAIRFFTVENDFATTPQQSFAGTWQVCSPATAPHFSAVGYFFARELRQRLGVPVGVIISAWNGSPAQGWVPLARLQSRGTFYKAYLDQEAKFSAMGKAGIFQTRDAMSESTRLRDPGNTGEQEGWARPTLDTAEWKDIPVPGYLEPVFGETDGACWFRREVELPATWANTPLTLRLGAVDDLDETYVNGVKVGGMGREVPEVWNVPRVYRIPAELVRAGKNVIAVRVFDEREPGGLPGPALTLEKEGEASINLAGTWKAKMEQPMKPIPWPAGYLDLIKIYRVGSYLYNGMIAPAVPCALRGVIWYQGESNADAAEQYRTLFPDLISAWREAWGRADLPFYYVQLANYQKRTTDANAKSAWAMLRDAQRQTLSVPHTGMAVAIDIGDEKRIHPLNKQDVGSRLALQALAGTYGKKIEASGPVYQGMTVEGNAIRLTFTHAKGLMARGGVLKGFAICGADHKFVWADARIDGETVIVSQAAIATPVAVRYGWADNPECTLYNAAGLPASPFRTDDFPR